MNVDRLNTLADFLEHEVPKKRFDMGTWVTPEDYSAFIPEAGEDDENIKITSYNCGFAGCAWGWATAVPEFFAAGVHIKPEEEEVYFGESSGLEAAKEFFDIDEATADFLFMPGSYFPGTTRQPGPKTVAKRLRSVAKKGHI